MEATVFACVSVGVASLLLVLDGAGSSSSSPHCNLSL
jgi:hypothetical protein